MKISSQVQNADASPLDALEISLAQTRISAPRDNEETSSLVPDKSEGKACGMARVAPDVTTIYTEGLYLLAHQLGKWISPQTR